MKQSTMNHQKTHKQVIDGLSHLLADTYVLYLKTQNFHWNVEGPNFIAYHKLFEEQYLALAGATDLIAERIRALGALAPASFKKFSMLTSLDEAGSHLSAEDMIKELLKDHETISKQFEKLFAAAQKCKDEATLDLYIERKREHDKIAWMLRSTLSS